MLRYRPLREQAAFFALQKQLHFTKSTKLLELFLLSKPISSLLNTQ